MGDPFINKIAQTNIVLDTKFQIPKLHVYFYFFMEVNIRSSRVYGIYCAQKFLILYLKSFLIKKFMIKLFQQNYSVVAPVAQKSPTIKLKEAYFFKLGLFLGLLNSISILRTELKLNCLAYFI